MVKKKTCVFISGRGSNLRNLILHSRYSNFPIKISLVISNNKEAYGINYAKGQRGLNKLPYDIADAYKKTEDKEQLKTDFNG